jgi:serine/threonine-protein kinase
MVESSPQKFGRYEVRTELGSGAMGVVYRGFDPEISREVAIKTIKRSLDLPPNKRQEYLERFRREAQAAGRLSNHPNIVPVFDVGQEGELPFIVMAFVEGDSLDRSRRKAKLDSAALDALASEICSALGHAHRNGIVHRDVKPANILMTPRGAMLTDFGIARLDGSELTRVGTFLGSPSYMSPEQVKGGELGGTSDLFSMAVILYFLMAGEKPFRGEDTNEILYKIVHEKHIPISVIDRALDRWDAFFDKALAKNAGDRFADAEQFYLAFNRTLESKDATKSTLGASTDTAPAESALLTHSPATVKAPATSGAPAVPAPRRESRVNPLNDRSMFFNVDVKNRMPSRRSGSATDSGRLERLLKGGGATGRRRGRDGKLPPVFWAAMLGASILLGTLVYNLWPHTVSKPPQVREPAPELSKPKRSRP